MEFLLNVSTAKLVPTQAGFRTLGRVSGLVLERLPPVACLPVNGASPPPAMPLSWSWGKVQNTANTQQPGCVSEASVSRIACIPCIARVWGFFRKPFLTARVACTCGAGGWVCGCVGVGGCGRVWVGGSPILSVHPSIYPSHLTT